MGRRKRLLDFLEQIHGGDTPPPIALARTLIKVASGKLRKEQEQLRQEGDELDYQLRWKGVSKRVIGYRRQQLKSRRFQVEIEMQARSFLLISSAKGD